MSIGYKLTSFLKHLKKIKIQNIKDKVILQTSSIKRCKCLLYGLLPAIPESACSSRVGKDNRPSFSLIPYD